MRKVISSIIFLFLCLVVSAQSTRVDATRLLKAGDEGEVLRTVGGVPTWDTLSISDIDSLSASLLWTESGGDIWPKLSTYGVSIGKTSAPTRTLDVSGTLQVEGAASTLAYFAGTNSSTLINFENGGSTGSAEYMGTSGNAFIFGVGGVTRMHLDATGLGIGTTTPAYRLDVYSNNNINGFLSTQATSSSSTKYAGYFYVTGALGTGNNIGMRSLVNATGGTNNYAGYFGASGSTNNYAIYVSSGQVNLANMTSNEASPTIDGVAYFDAGSGILKRADVDDLGTALATSTNYWTKTGSDLYYNTGGVSIGKASAPTRTLDIYGASNATAQIEAAAGNAELYFVATGTSQILSNADLYFTTTAASTDILFRLNYAEKMRLTDTGLGIGTTTPAHKLSVVDVSDGAVSRPLQVWNTGTALGTGAAIELGKGGIGNNASVSLIGENHASASDRLRINIGSVTPIDVLTLDHAGAVTLNQYTSNEATPTIDGVAYFDAGSGVLKRADVDDLGTALATSTNYWTLSGSNVYRSAGNVMIGRSSHEYGKLDVEGNMQLGTSSLGYLKGKNSGEMLIGEDAGAFYLFTGFGSGVTKGILIGDNSDFIRFTAGGTTRAQIQGATGNMQLGAGAPLSTVRFDVANTTSTYSVRANNTHSSANEKYGFYTELSGAMGTGANYGLVAKALSSGATNNYAGYFSASGATNNYGVYSAAGTNYFNGNVGMGILPSSIRLEVAGKITAKASDGFQIANSNETLIANIYSNSGVLDIKGDGGRSVSISSVTAGEYIRFDGANGRLGVGITSPSERIEFTGGNIYANVSNGQGIRIGANNAIYRQNANELGFVVNTSERMRLNATGLGIGTTSPEYALDIVSDFLQGGGSLADLTNKSFRFTVRKYNLSDLRPFVPFMGTSTTAANYANIGGGSSLGDAATVINFYTASGVTTATGTLQASIDANGALTLNQYTSDEVSPSIASVAYFDAGSGVLKRADVDDLGTALATSTNYWTKTGSDIYYNTGNVGIGVTSPSAKLHIDGGFLADNAGAREITWTPGNNIGFKRGDVYNRAELRYQSSSNLGLWLSGGSAEPTAYVRSQGGDDIRIGTTSTDRLTVTNAGSVGIGTTTPGSSIHVNTTGTGALRITGASSGHVNASVILESTQSAERGGGIFMHNSFSDTEWYAGRPYLDGDKYMIGRVDSIATHADATATYTNAFVTVNNIGNLGIGTTTPLSALDIATGKFTVRETSTVYHQIKAANNNFVFTSNAGAGNVSRGFQWDLSKSGGAVSTKMVLDSDGNVGIGTTTPDRKLSISTTGGGGMNLVSTDATAQQVISFKDSGGETGAIVYEHTGNKLWLKTNGAERFSISSTGALTLNNYTSNEATPSIDGVAYFDAGSGVLKRADVDDLGTALNSHPANQILYGTGTGTTSSSTHSVATNYISTQGYNGLQQSTSESSHLISKREVGNISSGATAYLGYFEGFGSFTHKLRISVASYLGYANFELDAYSTGFTTGIITDSRNARPSRAEGPHNLIPVFWVDGTKIHVSLKNNATNNAFVSMATLYSFSNSTSNYWVPSSSTTVPVGWVEATPTYYMMADYHNNNDLLSFGDESISIDYSAKNVMVGTSSNPENAKFFVNSTDRNQVARVENTYSSSTPKYSLAAISTGALGTGANYGTYSYVSSTGATTNYAGYFDASGAATNYGIYSANGINYFNDKVGFGVLNPVTKIDVNGGVNIKLASYLTFGGAYAAGKPAITGTVNGLEFHPDGSTSGASVVIDDAGDLGIGITSPTYRLHQDGGTTYLDNLDGLTVDVTAAAGNIDLDAGGNITADVTDGQIALTANGGTDVSDVIMSDSQINANAFDGNDNSSAKMSLTGSWARLQFSTISGNDAQVSSEDDKLVISYDPTTGPTSTATFTNGHIELKSIDGSDAGEIEVNDTAFAHIDGGFHDRSDITPAALGTTENNYNPAGLLTTKIVRLNAASGGSTITGISAGGDGQVLILINTDAIDTITLSNNSTSSALENRIRCPGGADHTIPIWGTATLRYDTLDDKWYIIGITE